MKILPPPFKILLPHNTHLLMEFENTPKDLFQ